VGAGVLCTTFFFLHDFLSNYFLDSNLLLRISWPREGRVFNMRAKKHTRVLHLPIFLLRFVSFLLRFIALLFGLDFALAWALEWAF